MLVFQRKVRLPAEVVNWTSDNASGPDPGISGSVLVVVLCHLLAIILMSKVYGPAVVKSNHFVMK